MSKDFAKAAEIISDMEKMLAKLKKTIFTTDESGMPKKNMTIKKGVVFYYEESLIIANKKIIKLTKTDGYILNTLLCSENYFATYEALCQKVYGYYDKGAIINIRVAISRLRKKVSEHFEINSMTSKGCFIDIK